MKGALPVTCRYGFVVMDGNGSLFGTVSGNTREVRYVQLIRLGLGR